MSSPLDSLKNRINTLKKSAATSSSEPAAPVAAAPAAAAPVAPAAAAPAAPTGPDGGPMAKLAGSINKMRATAPVAAAPVAAAPVAAPAANAPAAPSKVAATPPTDDQLTKAQLEKLASDPNIAEDFSKLAAYAGALLFSTEAGRIKAAALIDEHRGQQIGAALMAKAAGHMQALSEEQEYLEKVAAEKVQFNNFINAEFAKLSPERQEFVKRAHLIHAQNVGVYEREFLNARDAALSSKSASADKESQVKSAFERFELLKSAYAGGADDMGAMIESAGPEGENIDGATIEEAPMGTEGDPQFSAEEILMLIEQAVASGQITPEEGEQAKAALSGGMSPEEQMAGPGAEEAKAARHLVSAILKAE